MRFTASTILALTCLLAPAGNLLAAPPPDTVEFRFAPRPGRAIRQRIVTRTVGATRLPPPLPEMKFTQTFEQELTTTCKHTQPDGSAVMELVQDRLAIRASSGPMSVQIDTRTFDPQQPQDAMTRMMGQVLKAMTGSRITLTLNAAGKPAKVEGIKEVFDRVVREVKESPGDDWMARATRQALGQVFEQLGTVFEDESMLRQMEAYYRIAPSKPGVFRVGEKWDHEWRMDLPMLASTCTARGEYELVGIEKFRGRPCAKIRLKETFSVTSQPDKEEQTKPSNPLGKLFEQMEFSLQSSSGDGIAYWDYTDGTLVQLLQTQRITLDARMPTPATAPEGRPTEKTDTADTQEPPPLPGGQLTQQFTTSISMDLIEDGEESDTLPASETPEPGTQVPG